MPFEDFAWLKDAVNGVKRVHVDVDVAGAMMTTGDVWKSTWIYVHIYIFRKKFDRFMALAITRSVKYYIENFEMKILTRFTQNAIQSMSYGTFQRRRFY